MSSQIQYKPVSTSCMNVYNKIEGDIPSNTKPFFVIKHPDGRSMKLGTNNMVQLNEGTEINFTKYAGDEVYNSRNDNIALFKDSNNLFSLRHTGYVLYLHPFSPNNFDFAWYFEPDGNGFNIYNEYGGGMYIGYDANNDQLRIVPQSNKVTWKVEEHSGNDSKRIKKALAFMNKGQGKYNDVFEGADACVFPHETLTTMNMESGCLLRNSDTHDVVNNNFVQSIGGVMDQNRTIANENIAQGKGLYPSNGCGIRTNESGLFKQAVADSGSVIDFENQKILNSLRDKITKLKLEIKDISQVKIPNQRRVLAAAIQRYEEVLADCNYHKWLKPWLINYGIPYIKNVINQNRGYLNWLENSYWPAVNNYGKWLSGICRQNNSRALFYEHCGYEGQVGYVDASKTGNTINWLADPWNDRISSIKIPPGIKVTIWEDTISSGTGQKEVLTNNVDCLVNMRYGGRGGNWNDQITGLKVEGELDPSVYGFNMAK